MVLTSTETGQPAQMDDADAIARAVALAYVLPHLDLRGRAAGARLRALLVTPPETPLDDETLARVLVDADVIMRLTDEGRADAAQAQAVRDTQAAFASAPYRLTAGLAQRAAQAAGSIARSRYVCESLDGPRYAAAVSERCSAIRASRGAARPPDPRGELTEARLGAAVSAAVERACVAALDERSAQLDQTAALVADQLRDGAMPPAVDPAAHARVRERLASAAHGRRQRAARLADRLLAMAQPAGAPAVAAQRPGDPHLDWLRATVNEGMYTPGFERTMAAWLGTDPFRLRALPQPAPFLAGLETATLEPEHVAPLLRRISLTQAAPRAQDLAPGALDLDPGPVSTREARLRDWGRSPGTGTPRLPDRTRIPRVVHGIWLGGPLPESCAFRENFAHGARRYAGEVDFVLWTDIPRAVFAAAMAAPVPPRGRPDPLAAVRGLLDWARGSGVLLVDIFEVFHAAAPMTTHAQFVLEMSKLLPRGYAAASDLLRIEIVERFGGAYADGDLGYGERDEQGRPTEALPAFFDRLAASVPGFTMNPLPQWGVGNDIVAGPAHHPALRLWLECTRLNYFSTQPEIFGGLEAMALKFVGEGRCALRYIVPHRTGRMHHRALQLLGLAGTDLPPAQPAFQFSSAGSWIPPATGEPLPAEPLADEEVLAVLARCLTFLQWQMLARPGNLYLTAVDPVVRCLPDPDAAWTALLTVLPALAVGSVPEATSVTDVHRRDDGAVERVDLPPEAEALLERGALAPYWLGAPISADGAAVWLLDERVAPIALRDARTAAPAPVDALAPLAETALDLLGRPVGLWIRPAETALTWRYADRFASVPGSHFGVSVGGAPGTPWEVELRPEALAELLLGIGAIDRPVLLAAPLNEMRATRRFADRLGYLIGQPVEVVEGQLRPPGGAVPRSHAFAPITYEPYLVRAAAVARRPPDRVPGEPNQGTDDGGGGPDGQAPS